MGLGVLSIVQDFYNILKFHDISMTAKSIFLGTTNQIWYKHLYEKTFMSMEQKFIVN